ncbi:MAG: peptidylprolyl isomerase [Bacteroidia bacterium]|nr:peptidylprolyl isomerase [Bacteroidia bacterium]
MLKKYSITLILIISATALFGQGTGSVLDEVVAIIGNTPVLRSECDIEFSSLEMEIKADPKLKCLILQQLLIKKMLLHQAKIDSLPISNEQLEGKIDNKIRFFESQVGSREQLEKYLGKSIEEYKGDIREKMRDQMLIEEMQNKILSNIKISPSEVREFYARIPKDSLPLISSELEVAQIIVKPKVSEYARQYAREQVQQLRDRIMRGESFEKLATLWSEDPGSKINAGLLDEFGRNEMVPEFERAAFKLGKDSISKVIETQFGFHIIKVENKRGERIIARHILIRPKTTSSDLLEAKMKLDSIIQGLNKDSIDFYFCKAAKLYSEDKDTKGNCGYFSDPSTGSNRLSIENLDKDIAYGVAELKPGELSNIELITLPDNSKAYRVIYLKSETQPHIMNPLQDYQKLQLFAQDEKKQKAIDKWVEKKRKVLFIKIDSKFLDCDFAKDWNTKS